MKQRKVPRGNPESAPLKWRSVGKAHSSAQCAAKELKSFAVHMLNMSNRMSPSDAQTNECQIFLVCSRAVHRWVELWETTGLGEEGVFFKPKCLQTEI